VTCQGEVVRYRIVTHWYKRSIENHPDEVEAPAQTSYSDWSDLHYYKIEYPIGGKVSRGLDCFAYTYQFDAVASAEPLARIDRLFISVGYNQGTPL
jgi:regulation of enolase protein 1 (concanavalin A-like superfamily)